MKKLRTYFSLIVFLSFWVNIAFGQQELKTFPDTLEYKTQFERLRQLVIYNDGNSAITIDSIFVEDKYYEARFDRNINFPETLAPGDTLIMDCILWNIWAIPYGNYNNTLIIYSDAQNGVHKINTSVGFEYQGSGEGKIEGFVKSGGAAVEDAVIYFYINGIKLIDSAKTIGSGFYSIELMPGSYFISAQKENYNLSFGVDKLSPVDADFISLSDKAVLNVDFNLEPVIPTSFSIHGNIFDKQINSLSKKRRGGIIIARSGGHNPSKLSHSENNNDLIFAGEIYPDGSYSIKNIKQAGYYYIQAFSEFYIPGYYSSPQSSSQFWQQADSVFIGSEISGFDIFLERDSSYGGGIISGKITADSDSNFVNTILYAQSVSNGKIYTHNFVDKNGNYKITGLPFGSYKVIGQLIDYDDAVSATVGITHENYYVPDINLEFKTTEINQPENLPADFELYQNYPNPFNPVTIIKYSTPVGKQHAVSLQVFDMLGNEIAVLVSENKSGGTYEIEFDASRLPSGIYFYQLISGRFIQTKKMILLK
ncbi:MAG: T9SS type A sorting domain-containing protein [Melioribacteraceae bacterium]|nr:MAG: T9SS type A sorting domain-containing protein [Melioribacteraceae bacterium]